VKESLEGFARFDQHQRVELVVVTCKRPGSCMQGFANKFVGYKEEHHAEACIQRLFKDKTSFSDEYAVPFLDVVFAFGRVPDLPAVDHIEQIIVLGPKVREPGLHQTGVHRAGKCGNERVAAIELPVVLGALQDAFEKIIHLSKIMKFSRNGVLGFLVIKLSRRVSGVDSGMSSIALQNCL